jgi:membrane protease YdiL (CAAX protease family)
LGAVVAISVSAVLFAMPHLGQLAPAMTIAYLASGAALGLVYVITGSLTATMVSHSLQSMAAFGQILVFGRGDHHVSWIVWALVFGAPLWVWLVARGLCAISPLERTGVRSGRGIPVD